MRRFLPALLMLTGCGGPTVPRLVGDGSIVDAARPDASRDATVVDAARDATTQDAAFDASDGSADGGGDGGDAAMDAGFDAGFDAGTTTYCTVASTLVLSTVATASTVEPAVATLGGQLVVAWVETRGSQRDLFARRVPATGALGGEIRLTNDSAVESAPSLVPSGTDYVVAYAHGTGQGSDVATASFDPVALSLGGANDVTVDTSADASPVLSPIPNGIQLFWERTVDPNPASAVTVELSTNGTPAGATLEVTATPPAPGPYAVDATSSDYRLYYAASATSLGSYSLTSLGVDSTLNDVVIPMPGALKLGGRVRATPADATPRAVLTAALSGTRTTAVLQRMSSTGARLGAAVDVDATRTSISPGITVFGGYAIVAYRAKVGTAGEVRFALVRANGTVAANFSVVPLATFDGSLEIVALADGSGLDLVLDDTTATTRELRVLRLACTLP